MREDGLSHMPFFVRGSDTHTTIWFFLLCAGGEIYVEGDSGGAAINGRPDLVGGWRGNIVVGKGEGGAAHRID